MNESNLIGVNEINQYIYCPRRYYYIKFYDTIESNYYLVDGTLKHKRSSRRGGWFLEVYLKSQKLGLHGKIDVLENGEIMTPVERKRGKSYYINDEIQLSAYCMLLEEAIDESINVGYIYLYESKSRHLVHITPWHRKKVLEIAEAIRNMSLDKIPDFADNPKKCEKCSTAAYCLPKETRMLEGENAKEKREA